MLAPWIKFILPTAPRRSITCNGGAVMNGWYDIESLQNRDKNEYEGKQASVDYIRGLIQSETKAVPSERIMVCGFSQGGAMSLYTALLSKMPLAGIICCSGYLLDFKIKSAP